MSNEPASEETIAPFIRGKETAEERSRFSTEPVIDGQHLQRRMTEDDVFAIMSWSSSLFFGPRMERLLSSRKKGPGDGGWRDLEINVPHCPLGRGERRGDSKGAVNLIRREAAKDKDAARDGQPLAGRTELGDN
ncbi:hypothetical protein KM043_004736 [Ampulex compressa]|nr:hypothetical protein KM043_004736 [Ampulex compressa]